MSKVERQHQLVKLLASSPWTYTLEMLASCLATSANSIYRDLNELEGNGYQFAHNESGRFFLKETGWDGFSSIKDATIRQVEMLRFLAAHDQGAKKPDVLIRFTRDKEISEKTIERDLEELGKRHLICEQNERCLLNSSQLLPPLQLDAGEKSFLIEALALQGEVSARRDEAKSITAKMRVSLRLPGNGIETVVVHGRRPVENLRRSHYCQRLEEHAQAREKIRLLYRRGEEADHEVSVNPLGIVYYWALDNRILKVHQ